MRRCRKRYWRERYLRITYNLTIELVEDLRAKQGGTCAICGTSAKRLVIDHDHQTGRVRGLLCDPCNTGLGKLGDTVAAIERAIRYLKAEDSSNVS
jgi:hypothetical protein